jgi:outer membrane murein-binding lipoprotein Lpp
LQEDEMIFIGAAIILAQASLVGTADETHIKAAVTTAQRLHSEVRRRREETNAEMGFGVTELLKKQAAEG